MTEFYAILEKIVKERGTDILQNKTMFLGNLKDYAPKYKLENKLLAKAMEEKVHLLFYKNQEKDLNEKKQLVSKARWILGSEMYLKEEAVERVIVSFLILASWKESYQVFLDSEMAEEYEFREWCKKLENPNESPEKLRETGICYYNGKGRKKDVREAVNYFKKAAELGDAEAQFWIGFCYNAGEGVTKDTRRAVSWYEKAAIQGENHAQCNLAYCYYSGDGVEQEDHKAVYWFSKSAEQGNLKAQTWLAYCYEVGRGVKQSYEKAIFWYEKAAKRGDEYAENKLSFLT